MATLGSLVDEVLQIVKGYGLYQPRGSYLTAGIDADDLTITVRDASSLDQGVAELGGVELVLIDSVNRSTNQITLAPDGRGYGGTLAQAHAADARLDFNAPWPRNRVRQVINDTIVATYPTLFGMGTTQFTYVPSVTTYSLPVEAEKVLSVTAETIGPSRDQQKGTRYSFNSVAPSDDWPTGNTVTLQEPVTPGQTVTVTYLQRPVEIEGEDGGFTSSGLQASAKRAIVYGTCHELLTFMDMARLPTDTAASDEYDDRNAVGTATRISNQLMTKYQMELEQERKRLRSIVPVAIYKRTR